ncbi:unnamed protein product [Urochloa humidicola]
MATTAASPTSAETTAAVQDGGLGLPTDAFVDILLHLPSSCRRWVARLVCRHWRDVIDARTPRIPQPKVLTFFTGNQSASAYVVNNLKRGWGRKVWRVTTTGCSKWIHVTAVGTCNGLLCLCDEDKPGGAISLLNPMGE